MRILMDSERGKRGEEDRTGGRVNEWKMSNEENQQDGEREL